MRPGFFRGKIRGVLLSKTGSRENLAQAFRASG